ncbi:hypothetical protein BSBH6_03764 [Bacillus subtilis]|nr:hypothetical protein BSBH6_03764 [Bacillus subtilis]RPK20635.1 hypothetical protein BH5_03852 [Bacillus subtilis]
MFVFLLISSVLRIVFFIILISKPAPTVAPYLEKRMKINH